MSTTTAKIAILLPVFMVVVAVYGASNGDLNNFGRNMIQQFFYFCLK
tara:strand:- start:3712 stop:3852 length:141 start_codon:yes stop_codon:yes gene_type:complete